MRILIILLVAIGLLPVLPGEAMAADPVGSVHSVKVYAYGTPPSAKREVLYARSGIFMDEKLETVKDGGLRVGLKDGSNLVLGSDSTLIVDNLVYDAGTKSGRTNLTLRAGFYRYAAAYNPNRRVTLKTPTATIGIRGTNLIIIVGRDGSTQVKVTQGSVQVASRRGGGTAVVSAGEQVTVSSSGGITRVADARGASGDRTVDFADPYRGLPDVPRDTQIGDDSNEHHDSYGSGSYGGGSMMPY